MKTNKLLVLAAAALALVGCKNNNTEASPKYLVLYYSQTGTTETLANEIANQLGVKAVSFDLENPYTGTYDETIQRCIEEREKKAYSAVDNLTVDITEYDVIFLGYPVWFGTCAIPITPLSFQYYKEFNGKTIVPFCTFGSGGLESSVADLRNAFDESNVLDGFGIRAARIGKAHEEVAEFLISGGFIEGEIEALPEYGEDHPVNEGEIDIFNEACGGYPMPLGTPVSVCIRERDGVTDYIFTAVSTMGDEGETQVKIHITCYEDSTVEFTKVVR